VVFLCCVDGVDYVVGNTSIIIPASRVSRTQRCGGLSLTVLDDTVVEGDETFTVFLSTPHEPSRVRIHNSGRQDITIVDDDRESPFPCLGGRNEISWEV